MPTKTKRTPLKMEVTAGKQPSRLERMRAKLGDGGTAPAPVSREATPATPSTEAGRRVVDIDKLVENPGNERKTFRGMEGIKATVEKFGILEPPTVEPKGDGTYLLVTGHRRTRAARELGLTQIEVLVRTPDDEKLRRRKSLVSNIQHQDVDAIELAGGLQLLLDEDDDLATQSDLAAAIGKSKAWVSETLGILRLKPALQAKVKSADRQLPYDAVSKIARADEKDQAELIDALLSGAGVTEIRRQIANKKGGSTKVSAANARPAKRETAFVVAPGVSVIIRTEGLAADASLDPVKALELALAAASEQGDMKQAA